MRERRSREETKMPNAAKLAGAGLLHRRHLRGVLAGVVSAAHPHDWAGVFLPLDATTDRALVTASLAKLSDTIAVTDTGAPTRFLDAKAPMRPGPMGSVGYCMWGRQAVSVAETYPEQFRASAGLHPTSLISDRPDSPHLGLNKLRDELYSAFAETDPYAPLATIQELDGMLARLAAGYQR
jgi:carboxymethylenebutenolidase